MNYFLRFDVNFNFVIDYYDIALLIATNTTIIAFHENFIIEQLIDVEIIINKIIDHNCDFNKYVTTLSNAIKKNNMKNTRILLFKNANINLFYETY